MTQTHPLDHDGDGKKGGSLPKRSQEEINAEKRDRAARQATKTAKALASAEEVTCRVLPFGDGKVSTGEHVAGIGELHYEKGETFALLRPLAEALQERGYVEIQ